MSINKAILYEHFIKRSTIIKRVNINEWFRNLSLGMVGFQEGNLNFAYIQDKNGINIYRLQINVKKGNIYNNFSSIKELEENVTQTLSNPRKFYIVNRKDIKTSLPNLRIGIEMIYPSIIPQNLISIFEPNLKFNPDNI